MYGLLAKENDAVVGEATEPFKNTSELGTVAHGPGVFWYRGVSKIQDDDLSTSVDGNDKFRSTETFLIAHLRLGQGLEQLDALLKSFFSGKNGSIC